LPGLVCIESLLSLIGKFTPFEAFSRTCGGHASMAAPWPANLLLHPTMGGEHGRTFAQHGSPAGEEHQMCPPLICLEGGAPDPAGGVEEYGTRVAGGWGRGGGEQGHRIAAEDEQMCLPLNRSPMRLGDSQQRRTTSSRGRRTTSSRSRNLSALPPPRRGQRAPGRARWSFACPPRSSARPSSSSSTTALSS
jgi:hypothetical protein